MKVNIINAADGKAKGAVDVSDDSFGVRFNEALVHQVVTAYQAGARQGTRGQKNRSDVRGGGRKPWNQKGGGRARAGSIRSPIWRGGGKTFPAVTQDFSQKVNKKMYRAAMRAIVSELLRQERLVAVDEFKVDSIKTRGLVDKLTKLGAANALIVTESVDENLFLSARNLYRVNVCDAAAVDPVSLVGYEKIIMTVPALKRIEEMLA